MESLGKETIQSAASALVAVRWLPVILPRKTVKEASLYKEVEPELKLPAFVLLTIRLRWHSLPGNILVKSAALLGTLVWDACQLQYIPLQPFSSVSSPPLSFHAIFHPPALRHSRQRTLPEFHTARPGLLGPEKSISISPACHPY